MALWYEKLYTGQNAALIYDKIHKSVEEERYIPGVYLITLSSNQNEQLDIYDSIQLYMPALRQRLSPIIGIACGNEEAMGVFQIIAEDVLQKTGGLRLREYFTKEMGIDKAIGSETV